MAKHYIGKAALTVVRQKSNSSRIYVYAGQPVGEDVDSGEIARLEAEGFIEAIEIPETIEDFDLDGDAGDGPPAESANKDAWIEYAIRKGHDRDEAEKATKADLIKALS